MEACWQHWVCLVGYVLRRGRVQEVRASQRGWRWEQGGQSRKCCEARCGSAALVAAVAAVTGDEVISCQEAAAAAHSHLVCRAGFLTTPRVRAYVCVCACVCVCVARARTHTQQFRVPTDFPSEMRWGVIDQWHGPADHLLSRVISSHTTYLILKRRPSHAYPAARLHAPRRRRRRSTLPCHRRGVWALVR
jgi:hypothetical protein